MTGYGEARHQGPRWTITAEVRSVNNRHFKCAVRISDAFAAMEPALEQLVRDKVKRGTVHLVVGIDRPSRPEDYRLNLVALSSYRDQLARFDKSGSHSIDLAPLLMLPGVVEKNSAQDHCVDDDWPALSSVVERAVAELNAARAREGQAMAQELLALAGAIERQLGQIVERGPIVVQANQKRLLERIQSLVKDQGITIESRELVREVAVMVDRGDISEEVVRLRAHLEQYNQLIGEPASAGRKLEFIVQEMGREINTIGSKANDVEISRCVVEVKAFLERIRELIQNVE
jgi:uncharacterized protein (TIGR00255 family)